MPDISALLALCCFGNAYAVVELFFDMLCEIWNLLLLRIELRFSCVQVVKSSMRLIFIL